MVVLDGTSRHRQQPPGPPTQHPLSLVPVWLDFSSALKGTPSAAFEPFPGRIRVPTATADAGPAACRKGITSAVAQQTPLGVAWERCRIAHLSFEIIDLQITT